jgi:hypothetical protein
MSAGRGGGLPTIGAYFPKAKTRTGGGATVSRARASRLRACNEAESHRATQGLHGAPPFPSIQDQTRERVRQSKSQRRIHALRDGRSRWDDTTQRPRDGSPEPQDPWQHRGAGPRHTMGAAPPLGAAFGSWCTVHRCQHPRPQRPSPRPGHGPGVEFVDWVRIRKRRSECERTEPSLTTLLRQQDIGGSLKFSARLAQQ